MELRLASPPQHQANGCAQLCALSAAATMVSTSPLRALMAHNNLSPNNNNMNIAINGNGQLQRPPKKDFRFQVIEVSNGPKWFIWPSSSKHPIHHPDAPIPTAAPTNKNGSDQENNQRTSAPAAQTEDFLSSPMMMMDHQNGNGAIPSPPVLLPSPSPNSAFNCFHAALVSSTAAVAAATAFTHCCPSSPSPTASSSSPPSPPIHPPLGERPLLQSSMFLSDQDLPHHSVAPHRGNIDALSTSTSTSTFEILAVTQKQDNEEEEDEEMAE